MMDWLTFAVIVVSTISEAATFVKKWKERSRLWTT